MLNLCFNRLFYRDESKHSFSKVGLLSDCTIGTCMPSFPKDIYRLSEQIMCTLGEEEYSMRALFFTWAVIIVVIGGLLLALVCVTHHLFFRSKKRTLTTVNNRYLILTIRGGLGLQPQPPREMVDLKHLLLCIKTFIKCVGISIS